MVYLHKASFFQLHERKHVRIIVCLHEATAEFVPCFFGQLGMT